MLKKANRLKSRGDFKRTLAGRRICANDCFVLYGLAASHPVAGSSALARPANQGATGTSIDPTQAKAVPDSTKAETKPSISPAREPRFGFIVSKKIHKKAVYRNKIRRRLRELARRYLLTERREAVSRYRTLVFIARSGSLEAGYQDLKNRMERCFRNP